MSKCCHAPTFGANGNARSRVRRPEPGKGLVAAALIVVLASGGAASAQSTLSPSGDWNGTYGFASNADQNLRLLQSDLIRKSEEGYYEALGRVTVNNNTVNNSTTEIGQQQTTIGVVSTSTNNIDVSNSSGASVGGTNTAGNSGCIGSNVSIDSQPAGAGPACR